MSVFLDITRANQYAATKTDLIALVDTFARSLDGEIEFFKHVLTPTEESECVQPQYRPLSTELLHRIDQHFHQLIGFLPIFTNQTSLDELKRLIKLVINDSSGDFGTAYTRLQEILEGLQCKLSKSKASYHHRNSCKGGRMLFSPFQLHFHFSSFKGVLRCV